MKHLLHDIQIWLMLALLMAGIQSCADGAEEVELVQMSFTATLPADAHSRSFGHADQVNTLVVGVFNDEYQEIDRKTYSIHGTSVHISLELIQSQTYHFVFWAYDGSKGFYNIDNLAAIRMNPVDGEFTLADVDAMDAFFAVKENVTVVRGKNNPVELVRPLDQINVGTSGKWMQASFTTKAVPDTFHPFTNTVSGSADCTWTFRETTAQTFTADGKDYTYLAMGYVFAPVKATSIAAELTLIEGDKSVTLEFPEVIIEANKKSNIAGKITGE